MEHARMIAAQRQAKDDEIERLQRENEMLEELTDRQSKHISDLVHENEELRNAIDQEMVIAHLGVFNRGDDPVKAIKELMLWSQGVGEYFAKEELAALKAQSTFASVWLWRNKTTFCFFATKELAMQMNSGGASTWVEPVEVPVIGNATPPSATALLGNLGDWVYERMQQADSDYNNHGDDTAEVYATLKMVLSKIESMIESLPLIGEKE